MDHKMVRTAITLAFDDEGMELVFGIAPTRRLVLLLIRLGFGDIHLVGQVSSFIPILSDLVQRSSFHSIETEESLERVAQELGVLGAERHSSLCLPASGGSDNLSRASKSNEWFYVALSACDALAGPEYPETFPS